MKPLTLIGGLCCIVAGLAAMPAQAAPGSADALRAEAFEAAQWAERSDSAEALAKLSARFAHGSGSLAQLAAQRDALATRRDQIARRLDALYAGANIQTDVMRAQTRKDFDDAQAQLDALDQQITSQFPAYAELTNPRPLPLAQTQALLKPNEALVFILVGPDASYIWSVSRDAATWARADDLGAKTLADDVSSLRAELTPSAADATSKRYDVQLAYHLYDRLIRPVEPVLQGKTVVLTVTTGPLTALPLALLPVDPPGAGDSDDALRRLHWMVDRYALATLPSVSSLKTLRCDLVVEAARAPGCSRATAGGPQANGQSGVPLVGFGAPALDPPRDERNNGVARSSDVPASQLFDGAHADREKLMQLRQLPGAKDELDALQARFPSAVVRTGADATVTAVETTDNAALSHARYVIFSTHGVLSGADVSADGAESLAEPGLVFTPPPTPTDIDDGYLRASQAAQLHLAADLVVLAACNTATSEGQPRGDGLSTLARSFFYAGARSLLVSHWAVADKATSDLILQTFGALESNNGQGRAAALQRAMLSVRATPGQAHPYFWAPFVIVGEPEQ